MLGGAGIVQYSTDPRTEWDLHTYSTKEDVLLEIEELPYKGGNTLTGNSQKYNNNHWQQ